MFSLSVNGNNYGCIYDAAYASDLANAIALGHQVGHHTWDHPHMLTLTMDEIALEMSRLTDAFNKILGFSPRYMRPPYGEHSDAIDAYLQTLGFRVIALWDVDPGDANGATVAAEQAVYASTPTGSHIALQHDPVPATYTTMVPYIIQWAQDRGLAMVTLGECLGDTDETLWYTAKGTPAVRDATWTCD